MSQLPDHTWVRDAAALAELAASMADAPWVALDSEANSMFGYRERVCLIQLNVGGRMATDAAGNSAVEVQLLSCRS